MDGGLFPVEVSCRAAPVTIGMPFRPAFSLPELMRPLPDPLFAVGRRTAPEIVIGVRAGPLALRGLIS